MKILKKILRIIANSLLVLLKVALAGSLFLLSWTVLTPYFRIDRNTEGDFFRNLPSYTIDVIALGSSHMQYAFNPGIFYTETGYYAYVMGSPCQPLSMSYNMLKEVLKTQKPSLVIVDVFTLLPQSETCYADGMYYKAIDEMTGENRLEAADAVPNEEVRLQYKYDLYMNHDNWKTIGLDQIEEQMESVKPAEGFNYDMGYVSMLPEHPRYAPLETYKVTEKVELLDIEKKELKQIADLCEENGINLLYVKTPYIIDQDCTNKLAAIWAYLDEIKVNHEDYIARAEELDWFIDMDGDTWHNNCWGAEIITKDIASIVKRKHLVSGHHDHETVEKLLGNMRTSASYLLMNEMNVNVYRLLETSPKYPGVLLCRFAKGKWTTLGDAENDMLNAAGLKFDFLNDYDQNYFAVVVNGKLKLSSDEPIDTVIEGKKVHIDEEHITIDGKEVCTPGEMDLVFGAENLNWYNAIPIDYVSRWFWKNGCDGFTCE